jgi:hypothetical protein
MCGWVPFVPSSSAIGGWDDATALNEDFELSQRYIASGQLVWFGAPAVRISAAAFPALARQHFYFVA